MKTYRLKIAHNENLLLVELPKVCDYKVTPEMIFVMDIVRSSPIRIKGSYSLIGRAEDVTEKDVEGLLIEIQPYWEEGQKLRVIGNAKFSYLRSFFTLIEEHIQWVNPIPRPMMEDYGWYTASDPEEESGWMNSEGEEEYYVKRKEYDVSEEKTFDKNRTLIFKINTQFDDNRREL